MTPKNRPLRVPGPAEIRRAATLLRNGHLVAFPTETVYGLGANALDAAAVSRIFEAKGRPSTSPLIVHVASVAQARSIVSEWPDAAGKLAERFWPGPLTIVLPKVEWVPDLVTAGLPTVGIRLPDHPVAQALIREAGIPVAAPSANRFTELSPTTAGDVPDELRRCAAWVLDGGAAPIGIESTVLSLADAKPLLLRPGMIAKAAIEAVIGPVVESGARGGAHPSPGLHPRHYSPATRLVLVRDGATPSEGRGAYIGHADPHGGAGRVVRMPVTPAEYGARLYAVLHGLDRQSWDWIAVEEPPDDPEWAAIRDRLERASGRQ